MEKKLAQRGVWGQWRQWDKAQAWERRKGLGYGLNGGSWKSKLEKYLLNNPEVTKSTFLLFWAVWAKKEKNGKDKIALHVQYEIPLWIDEWMDSHLFESKSG